MIKTSSREKASRELSAGERQYAVPLMNTLLSLAPKNKSRQRRDSHVKAKGVFILRRKVHCREVCIKFEVVTRFFRPLRFFSQRIFCFYRKSLRCLFPAIFLHNRTERTNIKYRLQNLSVIAFNITKQANSRNIKQKSRYTIKGRYKKCRFTKNLKPAVL